jgi:glycosyltransferase involved in cell wall biosynthesis
MKVTLVSENLSAGGAERQLVALARLLDAAGAEVRLLLYHEDNHFQFLLNGTTVRIIMVPKMNKAMRVIRVRQEINKSRPDVVIAFKTIPSLVCELARMPRRRWKLIVSERNHDYRGATRQTWTRMMLHRLADAVVCNSHAQFRFIHGSFAFLRDRLHVITNCVDLDHFASIASSTKQEAPGSQLRLLVLGRVHEQKNPLRFCQGVFQALEQIDDEIRVKWCGSNFFENGRPSVFSSTFLEMMEFIDRRGLEKSIQWVDSVKDVRPLFEWCDGLVLPSIHEGFPNVIGEAMACSRPVLASNVGDNEFLVKHEVNGLVFDPWDPQSIAESIVAFAKLRSETRLEMGRQGRKMAELELSESVFYDKYASLISEVLESKLR